MVIVFVFTLGCHLATMITKMVFINVVTTSCINLAYVTEMIPVLVGGTGGFVPTADIAFVV